MKGSWPFLVMTAVVWIVVGAVMWLAWQVVATQCDARWAGTGLSAECFAPAAMFFLAGLAVFLVADGVRVFIVLRALRRSGSLGEEKI